MEEKLSAFAEQLVFFNKRLNLIARTDIHEVLNRHIAHCLVLAALRYPAESIVVDWGTGGGLPLIPLAIAQPEVQFVGVDAVEKKTLATQQMARALGIDNVEVIAGRAESLLIHHTHSVSRATAPLELLWRWHLRGVGAEPPRHAFPAELVCLKGGELEDEISDLTRDSDVQVEVEPVPIHDPYFATKKIVRVQRHAHI